MSTLTGHFGNQHSAIPARTQVERVVSLLRWTYGLLPIIAGADKFAHALTNWDKYLSPAIPRITNISTPTFMSLVGIIEIVAGIIVLARPKLGSLIVGIWLIAIAINLLSTGIYL